MRDEELTHTIIVPRLIHAPMTVYQCQKCVPVHIQRGDRSMWRECSTPEAKPRPDVFKK
jgi:hypothetical protein